MTRTLRALSLAPLAAAVLTGCGGTGQPETAGDPGGRAPVLDDPGPVHVHGLGVNPADNALYIATHTGLFRAAEGETRSTRVGESYQDTMGFTIVGPDRFLGSGHPDLRTDDPPYLGLIESTDAGRSWSPVSLRGDADFHVLRAAGDRIVGYGTDFESRRQQLLVSDDGGSTWAERRSPMGLIDLAISPADRDVWVAAGDGGMARSADAGRTWRPLGRQGGLLAWARPRELYQASAEGVVSRSEDGGTSWQTAGDLGGQPAALASRDRVLYAALHTGVIKMSADGGASWTVRSRP